MCLVFASSLRWGGAPFIKKDLLSLCSVLFWNKDLNICARTPPFWEKGHAIPGTLPDFKAAVAFANGYHFVGRLLDLIHFGPKCKAKLEVI